MHEFHFWNGRCIHCGRDKWSEANESTLCVPTTANAIALSPMKLAPVKAKPARKPLRKLAIKHTTNPPEICHMSFQ